MANRETYPASQSPLSGDISAPAGATTATVIGLQTQPIAPTIPTDKDVLRFNTEADTPEWEPTADGNASVTIGTFSLAGGVVATKGLTISDDYEFSVNHVGIDGLVGWAYGFASEVFVNGSPI
jgi:hypothetical protein